MPVTGFCLFNVRDSGIGRKFWRENGISNPYKPPPNELQKQQIEELNNILLGDKENHDESKVAKVDAKVEENQNEPKTDDKENEENEETKIDDKENNDKTEPVSTFYQQLANQGCILKGDFVGGCYFSGPV